MRHVEFEEAQEFPLWLWIVAGCVFVGISVYLVWVYVVVSDDFEDYVVLTWSGLLLMDLFMCNLFYMRTRVSDRVLSVRFGRFFPMMGSRVRLDVIRHARVVEYHPLWDAGGWGFRIGRFEGLPTRFMNARGNRGVYFEAKGRRYVIGSQRPEALLEAIARHADSSSSSSETLSGA